VCSPLERTLSQVHLQREMFEICSDAFQLRGYLGRARLSFLRSRRRFFLPEKFFKRGTLMYPMGNVFGPHRWDFLLVKTQHLVNC
jgi:hypothetical protein